MSHPALDLTIESNRLAALRRYEILDTPPEAEFDDFTQLASQLCDTPIALVTLVDAGRQWFKSRVGIELSETSREIAFCAHAITGQGVFEVADAVADERFRHNPLVTGGPGIRFYAGVPLTTPDGLNIGALCVLDHIPRHLSSKQLETLARLGRQVMAQLELRITNRRLRDLSLLQRAVLDGATTPIISVATDGTIATFNRAAEELLGYTADEVVGKETPALIHVQEEVVARAEELTRELGQSIEPGFAVFVAKASTGVPESREWTYVRKDGTRFAVILTVSALHDVDGNLTGYLGISRPLTAIPALGKESLAAFHVLGATLRTWLGRGPSSPAVSGTRRLSLFLASLGIAFSLFVFFAFRDSGRGGAGAEFRAHVLFPWLLLAAGLVLTAVGTAFVVLARVRAATLQLLLRERTAELTAALEVRERAEEDARSSEENLAVTLDSIGDAVLATDSAGKITRLNPVAERLTGWLLTDAIGRGIEEVFQILTSRTRERATIPVAEVLQTGEMRGGSKHAVLVSRDGIEYPIAHSAAPIRDAEDRTIGVVLVFRDVTAEHGSERALRASEEFNRRVVEASPDCVTIVSLDGHLLHMAQRGCELMEVYDFESIRNMEWLGMWKGEAEQPAHQAFETACLGGTGRFEGFCPTAKGVPRWWDVIIAPISGPNGETERLLCVSRDVTEDKRVKEEARRLSADLAQLLAERSAALQTSEERFAQLAENSGEVFWFFGLEPPRLEYISPAAEALFGLRPEALYGMPKRWNDLVHPHDRERVQASWTACLTGKAVFDEEYRIVRPDGTVRWVLDSGTVISDSKGRIIRVSGVAKDTTERKQVADELRDNEMRLRSMFLALDEGVTLLDENGLITAANEGAARILGLSSEQMIGRSALDPDWHVVREDGSAFPTAELPAAVALRTGSAQSNVIIGVPKPDDSVVWLAVNAQPLRRPGETRPRGVVTTFHDVTERRVAERQRLRAQRLESIGTLAGGVAHDLNNALAPILMGIGLLRMENPKSRELIDAMESSARRGADMVRQLLTFAKGVEGERLLVQPQHLLSETEKIMRSTFPKNIELRTSFEKDLAPILGDATQLHQVLLNLCVNARDAMPNGGSLTLSAENVVIDETYASSVPDALPGRFVAWHVKDTGTGIPHEIVDRIFEPFYSTKSADRGTGLGLSTVLGIVKGHGGFVHVQSAPGQGSTFSVFLPSENPGADSSPSAAEAIPSFQGNGETILVVDDEAGVRDVTRTVLQSLNFKVITSPDGTDALIQIAEKRHEVRAVITDVQMPHMDGLTFVRVLRRLLPTIGIIVASGRLEQKDEQEFQALGVDVLLGKPFSQPELVAALTTVFRK